MNTETLDIALIVASVRHGRTADLILPWLHTRLAARSEVRIDLVDLALERPDVDALGPGGTTTPQAERLAAAQAYFVLTPEYNHSFPGALKDLIDLHFVEWRRKPVAFVGYGARAGGALAVEQLRSVFTEVGATTVRDACLLAEPWAHVDGDRFAPPASAAGALDATVDELVWWGRTLRAGRAGRAGVPS